MPQGDGQSSQHFPPGLQAPFTAPKRPEPPVEPEIRRNFGAQGLDLGLRFPVRGLQGQTSRRPPALPPLFTAPGSAQGKGPGDPAQHRPDPRALPLPRGCDGRRAQTPGPEPARHRESQAWRKGPGWAVRGAGSGLFAPMCPMWGPGLGVGGAALVLPSGHLRVKPGRVPRPWGWPGVELGQWGRQKGRSQGQDPGGRPGSARGWRAALPGTETETAQRKEGAGGQAGLQSRCLGPGVCRPQGAQPRLPSPSQGWAQGRADAPRRHGSPRGQAPRALRLLGILRAAALQVAQVDGLEGCAGATRSVGAGGGSYPRSPGTRPPHQLLQSGNRTRWAFLPRPSLFSCLGTFSAGPAPCTPAPLAPPTHSSGWG